MAAMHDIFANANNFSFHPTLSLHDEMKTIYNEEVRKIEKSKGGSKDKVLGGHKIWG